MGKLSKQYMFLLCFFFESGTGSVENFHKTRFFYIANAYQPRNPYHASRKRFFSSDVTGFFSLKLPSLSLAEAVDGDK